MKQTVNITLKVDSLILTKLENYLNDNFELIDFSVIPDTEKMYLEDKNFQKLVKQRRDLKNQIIDYIYKNNGKYI